LIVGILVGIVTWTALTPPRPHKPYSE
jgi:hypothetical protein